MEKRKLTKEQEHDLYLRKVALGEIPGEMTGYASKDKPWLKYYSEEAIKAEFIPMSMYQLMRLMNEGHMSDIAMVYFGLKISYAQLLEQINVVADALHAMGVKVGEIVVLCLPNTPEAEYLVYALNKLGAVVYPIDPRSSASAIEADMEDTQARYVFTLDSFLPKFEPFLSKMVKQVITVSATQSLTGITECSSKDIAVVPWNTFIQAADGYCADPVFCPDSPAVIIHTGGSTGMPKGVVLSNENCNGLIYQMIYGEFGFRRNMTFLNILPPFVALGLNNAMHLAACLGLCSVMIPTFAPEEFPKLLEEYKPNVVMGGPLHFSILMKHDLDLSFLEICCSGGDKMPREMQEKVQNFLKDHNAKANIWLGYGATETSAGTTCIKNNCFRLESVGVPYLKNTLEVFDTETGEKQCGYGKIGELRVKAPTMMMGYFGRNKAEEDDVVFVDENQEKWYRTGDLAHFDEDGLLYIDGRIKRIILYRITKVYPTQIESVILRHPAVKECAVVGVRDLEKFQIPVAYIVLDSAADNANTRAEVIRYADNMIKNEVADNIEIAGYNFLPALPLTPIGKLDFRALEKLAEEMRSNGDM